MIALNKFENVDLIAALDGIMRQNTSFYRSDFESDKQTIQEAAQSPMPENKHLVWLSRPSGTYCFRERDIYIKDTLAHNAWRFYGEQTRDKILAYAVEITGAEAGKIRGNLYELDYQAHFKEVAARALPADTVALLYERGSREQPFHAPYDAQPDPEFGKFLRAEPLPNDPEALHDLLKQEQRGRARLKVGDLQEHIAALHNNFITAEARRIMEKMKEPQQPNSPDKTHFMVEVSPYFAALASSKDAEQLSSMLPYKSLSFSRAKSDHRIYAIIDKTENRDKKIHRSRPSIREQLAEAKAAASQKSAGKSKNQEREV